VTTVAKAKELRPFIEKLVTKARNGSLHSRRLVLSRLPNKIAVAKLFSEIGPRFAARDGGYTRILKLHHRRLGDAGETAIIEFLKAGEKKEVEEKQVAPTVAD